MRFKLCGASFCLLVMQVAAQETVPKPLTFSDIQAKARPVPEQWRLDTLVAERRLQFQETRGFLRDGPTVSLQTGPRRAPGAAATTDRTLDVDLPLFLSAAVRADLEQALGTAHPVLQEAARRESSLRLRAAYLDAWLAARLVSLREADLATVEGWLQVARLRFEAGADPAFQVSLVEGERLKVLQDLDEARIQEARSWGVLVALAEIPTIQVPLADPDPAEAVRREDSVQGWKDGPLRRALQAQLEIEERSLRLRESLSLSRLSLRGGFAQEGEDKVARIGVAIRLPRPGEAAAIRGSTEAQVRAVQGESRRALAEFDARAYGAVSRFSKQAPGSAAPDFTKAIQAVGLRLEEGRERPSEALPIRRQLLEAQMVSLRRIHSQHLLTAELQSLLPEVKP